MDFDLAMLLLVLGCAACWALGYSTGFEDGTDEGFDQGYEFATGDKEVRWRLTATGEAALDAPREPLADLEAEMKRRNEAPSAALPGVSFNPNTRQFQ